MPECLLELKNIYKSFGGVKALENISLKINSGEVLCLAGENGCGKSTLIKIISGFYKPDSGSIIMVDKEFKKMELRDAIKGGIQVVYQDFSIFPNLTVYENIAFAMKVVEAPSRQIKSRVLSMLSMVGLLDKYKAYPNELSGGEQQRVSLARALVNNPELIIADEPTGNIDPELSYEIMELLVEINKRGTTVLIVTHEHNLVNEFGGRIIKINGGKIVGDYIREVEQ